MNAMEGHRLRRARSEIVWSRAQPIVRSRSAVVTSRRVGSAPDYSSTDLWRSGTYKPFVYRYGQRDWNLFDEYWWDRHYYLSPLRYSPQRTYASRRYNYLDPPYSLSWYYPGLTSRYPRSSIGWRDLDTYDPLYWRRFRDPAYDRPLWYSQRPFVYESMDVERALKMYRRGLVNFDTLDKYWLTPSSWTSRTRQWNDYDWYGGSRVPMRYYSWLYY